MSQPSLALWIGEGGGGAAPKKRGPFSDDRCVGEAAPVPPAPPPLAPQARPHRSRRHAKRPPPLSPLTGLLTVIVLGRGGGGVVSEGDPIRLSTLALLLPPLLATPRAESTRLLELYALPHPFQRPRRPPTLQLALPSLSW